MHTFLVVDFSVYLFMLIWSRGKTSVNLKNACILIDNSPLTAIIVYLDYAGYSHKPEEYSSTEDIANGVKVLALTLAKLSLD